MPFFSLIEQPELVDPSSWNKVDKSGYIAKEVLGGKSSISRKRKSSTLRPKSKRLRIENEDLIELKLTWEEAQGLLRPAPNYVPSVVVIEGFEFEEYEVPWLMFVTSGKEIGVPNQPAYSLPFSTPALA